MKEDINVEAECKNCNHPISLHTPKCHIQYREFDRDRLCGCERPQYGQNSIVIIVESSLVS